MMSKIVGLISDERRVSKVKAALQAAGIAADRVGVLHEPADVWQRLNGRDKLHVVRKDFLLGALLGLVIGIFYGVPAGVLNCQLGGCTIITSLIFFGAIAFYWAVAGGLVGALIAYAQLEQDLFAYLRGVREGEAVVLVEASAQQIGHVAQIMSREAGTLVHPLE